jgi:hypothetical protein
MKIVWSQFQALNTNNLDAVPDKAGIYLLWTKLAGQSWRLVYVGEADSLQPSLRRLLTPAEPNAEVRRKVKCCVTGFEYTVQPDPEVRQGVSKYLSQYYSPECGSTPVSNEVIEVKVNLPGI